MTRTLRLVAAALALAGSLALVSLEARPAGAAVARTLHDHPNPGVVGVTYLCGPTQGYSCTPGYTGTNATGWAATEYGCPTYASGCPGTPHNCTLYAAFRLMENGVTSPGWSADANGWALAAWEHGTYVDQSPAVGAIAQWNAGLGHVAYVEQVGPGFIVVTMDDYYTKSPYPLGYTGEVRIATSSPAWPDNFVHFSDAHLLPSPSAGVDSAGDQFVFWRGTDGHLWEKSYTSGHWNGPAYVTVAGTIGSAPSVAVQSGGEQDVFYRGLDGNLWEVWNTVGWHGPLNLGASPLGSAPSAGADASGNQYVVWKGTDGHLWEKTYTGGRWNPPAKVAVAGKIGSFPSIAVHTTGEQDLFWRGADGNLWEAWYTGTWGGPLNLGDGQLGSSPAAGVDGSGNQYVYWEGTDGHLWEKYYIGDRWYPPLSIGRAGTIGSAPTVAVHGDGEQDVFWRGTDGNLWEAWSTGGWGGALNLGDGPLGYDL